MSSQESLESRFVGLTQRFVNQYAAEASIEAARLISEGRFEEAKAQREIAEARAQIAAILTELSPPNSPVNTILNITKLFI